MPFKEIIINPTHIDRDKPSHLLAPDEARILQRMDPLWQWGRVRRGKGHARMQTGASSTTVTSVARWCRNDCKRVQVDGNTNGDIRVTTGQIGRCVGPLPEWDDPKELLEDATDILQITDAQALAAGCIAAIYISSSGGGLPADNAGVWFHADPVFFGTNEPEVGYADDRTNLGVTLGEEFIAEYNTAGGILRATPGGMQIFGYIGASGAFWYVEAVNAPGTVTHDILLRPITPVTVNSTGYDTGEYVRLTSSFHIESQ